MSYYRLTEKAWLKILCLLIYCKKKNIIKWPIDSADKLKAIGRFNIDMSDGDGRNNPIEVCYD